MGVIGILAVGMALYLRGASGARGGVNHDVNASTHQPHTVRLIPLHTVAVHGRRQLCPRDSHHLPRIGFLGRWGTYARPQCLPSDTVPIRSWTRTLRPPVIPHRHLPYHTTIPCMAATVEPMACHVFLHIVLATGIASCSDAGRTSRVCLPSTSNCRFRFRFVQCVVINL